MKKRMWAVLADKSGAKTSPKKKRPKRRIGTGATKNMMEMSKSPCGMRDKMDDCACHHHHRPLTDVEALDPPHPPDYSLAFSPPLLPAAVVFVLLLSLFLAVPLRPLHALVPTMQID